MRAKPHPLLCLPATRRRAIDAPAGEQSTRACRSSAAAAPWCPGAACTVAGAARLAAAEAGSSQRGRDGRAGEKSEAEKVRSDVARLRGSYRYTRYGVAPPPAFSKRESAAYRRRGSSPSAASSSSSSRMPPSMAMVVKMEPDDAPAPAFAPGDYLDDAELERILPKLSEEAGLAPGDFVDERHLDIVIGTSHREADKAEEWRLVAQEQGKVYVDLGSDTE